jgi:hypothetical protein
MLLLERELNEIWTWPDGEARLRRALEPASEADQPKMDQLMSF